MTTLRELVTKLTFSADEAKVDRFDQAVGGLVTGLGAAVAAAGAATLAAFALGNSSSQVGDEIAKTSRELGIHSDLLQVLRFAADRAGVGQERLNQALRDGQKRLIEVSQGSGNAASAFEELGISVFRADGSLKNIDELLPDIADKIAAISSESRKAGLLGRIFGEEAGPRLALLLNEGSEGLQAYETELRSLNGILSEEALAASESYQDSLTNLDRAMRGLFNTLGTALLPSIQRVTDAMVDWIRTNREFISNSIDTTVDLASASVSALLPLAKGAANITLEIINLLGGAEGAIKLVNAALAAFIAFQITNILLVLPGAIGAVIASIVAAAASVSALVAEVGLLAVAVNVATAGLPLIIGALVGAGVLLIQNWETVSEWWSNFWSGAVDIVREAVIMISDWLNALTGGVFSDFFNGIKGIAGFEPESLAPVRLVDGRTSGGRSVVQNNNITIRQTQQNEISGSPASVAAESRRGVERGMQDLFPVLQQVGVGS